MLSLNFAFNLKVSIKKFSIIWRWSLKKDSVILIKVKAEWLIGKIFVVELVLSVCLPFLIPIHNVCLYLGVLVCRCVVKKITCKLL